MAKESGSVTRSIMPVNPDPTMRYATDVGGGPGTQYDPANLGKDAAGRQMSPYLGKGSYWTTFGDVKASLGGPINIQAPVDSPSQVGAILGDKIQIPELQKPSTNAGISSQTQSMIDILTRAAESRTKAAMIRRGMEGSSTEALGVGRAVTEASVPLIQQELEQRNKLELQSLQQEAERGNLTAQLELQRRTTGATLTSQRENLGLTIGADRGNMEAQLNLQRKIAEGQLTSDEVASLRAIADKTQDRELQKYLGEIGVNQASLSAQADRQSAEKTAKAQRDANILTAGIVGLPF